MRYRIQTLPEECFPQSERLGDLPLRLFDGNGKHVHLMIQGFDTETGEVRILCTDIDGNCILDRSKNTTVSKHLYLKAPLTVSK